MPKYKTSEEAKAASIVAHSPKANAKRKATIEYNRLLKGDIYAAFRQELIGDPNHPNYQQFIQKIVKTGLKEPNSRLGVMLAEQMMQQDIISALDAQTEKYLAKDRDFMEYRILKQLFDKQRDVFLDNFSRQIAVMCSRRAGKTELNPRILVKFCATPNTPCLYINLTATNSVQQCMQHCLDVAEEVQLPVEDSSFNKGFIKFSNGSTINFGGNKDSGEADKNRGFKYRLIIIDEAGHQRNMPYLMDEVLRPTLADFADSVLILTGTPPRRKNTYFEKAFNSKEWKSYHWTMFDNPFIPNPENVIESLCREKGCTVDSAFIQREYFGTITYDTEAQIFSGYKVYQGAVPADFKPDHIYIGVDYGFSDFNGIVSLAGNVEQRKAYIIHENKFNKATVGQIVEATRNAYSLSKEFMVTRTQNNELLDNIGIFCDTNEKSITYELNSTYGLPAYNAYKYNRDMAIEQLAEDCRTSRLLIPENGPLQDEFEQTLHPRDENDNILPGIDDFYHPDITMALLYASRQWFYDCGLDLGGESTNKKTGQF